MHIVLVIHKESEATDRVQYKLLAVEKYLGSKSEKKAKRMPPNIQKKHLILVAPHINPKKHESSGDTIDLRR